MVSLTIVRNPDGTEKHALKNVRETGEFCFNVVTEAGVEGNGGFGQCLRGGRFRVRRNRSYAYPERQDRGAACQGGPDPFRVQARTRRQPASFSHRRSRLYPCRSSL